MAPEPASARLSELAAHGVHGAQPPIRPMAPSQRAVRGRAPSGPSCRGTAPMSREAAQASSTSDSGCNSQSSSGSARSVVPLDQELVTGDAGLQGLEADWRRLHDLDAGAGVFNGWSANAIWWRHYGTPDCLRVLVLRHRGDVVAIAPFHLTRSVLLGAERAVTLRFIGRGGDTTPDDLDLIADPAFAESAACQVCDWLLRQRESHRWLFEDLPAHSPFAQALLSRLGPRVSRDVRHARRVAVLPDRVEAWRDGLSRNSRKHLTRRRRRAVAAGAVRYRWASAESLGERDFASLVSLHRKRRSALADPDPSSGAFGSAAYVAFHHEFSLALARDGALRLAVLELDDRPIGIEYALRHRSTLVFLQTGFDPVHAGLSPGHLLMCHLIERAIEEGVDRLDLLKGDYGYKASYARDTRQSVTLDLVRSARLARLVRLVDATRRRLRSLSASRSRRRSDR